MSVLLTRRAVVQAKIEAEYGVPEVLGVDDGVLVSEPNYEVDPTLLERDFTRDTLSQQAHIIGRKLAKVTFNTELRGNGKQHSGLAADVPIIGRLFQACGYKLIELPGPSALGPFDVDAHRNSVAWVADASACANTDVFAYYVKVTKGGASGVAEVAITSDTPSENSPMAAASGSVAFAGQPAEDDTITIGGTVWTFKNAAAAATEVTIGADLAATLTALQTALNASADVATAENVYTVSGSSLVITRKGVGASGNTVTLAVSGVNLTASGATLTGGSGAVYAITTGVPLTVGSKGLTLMPTFAGNLDVGDTWVVWLLPIGLKLKPISDNFQSATIALNKDGVLHVLPGAFGTFEIEAEAGKFAKIKWTFTGTWRNPVDQPMASPVYEKTLPAQVELARLRLMDFNAIVNKFTFDQGNDVQIRPDVSSPEGYIGTRIVSRKPEGGVDPEADRVANYDFWGKLGKATRMPFQMRVGTVQGNTVWMIAPSTQYTKMTYQDRTGILTYDAGLKFSGYQADDEMFFVLC
jgi:hypothetical protein